MEEGELLQALKLVSKYVSGLNSKANKYGLLRVIDGLESVLNKITNEFACLNSRIEAATHEDKFLKFRELHSEILK